MASSWTIYPTEENPYTRFKFTSFEISISADKLVVNRQTYSLLDWLGDLGGLFEALCRVCQWILAPVSSFALKATLLSNFFFFQPKAKPTNEHHFRRQLSSSSNHRIESKSQKDKNKLTLLESIHAEFMFVTSIKKMSFYLANLLCDKAYKKKMLKSHNRLTKELDLRKFIHRYRMFTTAIIGLLTGPQSLFVYKMSQLIIRESSDSETSGDDELND